MARTDKEFLEELVSWPECGGFQHERLAELMSEFESRIEALERGRVPEPEERCDYCDNGPLSDAWEHCPWCGKSTAKIPQGGHMDSYTWRDPLRGKHYTASPNGSISPTSGIVEMAAVTSWELLRLAEENARLRAGIRTAVEALTYVRNSGHWFERPTVAAALGALRPLLHETLQLPEGTSEDQPPPEASGDSIEKS